MCIYFIFVVYTNLLTNFPVKNFLTYVKLFKSNFTHNSYFYIFCKFFREEVLYDRLEPLSHRRLSIRKILRKTFSKKYLPQILSSTLVLVMFIAVNVMSHVRLGGKPFYLLYFFDAVLLLSLLIIMIKNRRQIKSVF